MMVLWLYIKKIGLKFFHDRYGEASLFQNRSAIMIINTVCGFIEIVQQQNIIMC